LNRAETIRRHLRDSVYHIWIFYWASFAKKILSGGSLGHTAFTVKKYGNVYSQNCSHGVYSVKDVSVVIALIFFLLKFLHQLALNYINAPQFISSSVTLLYFLSVLSGALWNKNA